jgi:hypothetical protein
MRMETFIREALRLKAHRVVTVEEDESAGALTVYLDRIGERRLRCGDIAAPYALRYMSLRTFFPMVFSRVPGVDCIVGTWPRRFTDGFRRLWERVAWRIDVRLGVNIARIARSAGDITIDMEYPEEDLNRIKIVKDTQTDDYLVLASPLTPDVFGRLGLPANAPERKISDAIKINPYCMTTFWIDRMDMPEPIAPLLPVPEPGKPWAVARQFQDRGSGFTQFYTRPTSGQSDDGVIAEVKKLVKLLGGVIDETRSRWHTFDKFTYFQHFTLDQFTARALRPPRNQQYQQHVSIVSTQQPCYRRWQKES